MILLQILGLAALGHLAADAVQTLSPELPQKPFQCNMCLTFWLGIAPMIYLHGYNGLFATALASVVSELMYRIINKL